MYVPKLTGKKPVHCDKKKCPLCSRHSSWNAERMPRNVGPAYIPTRPVQILSNSKSKIHHHVRRITRLIRLLRLRVGEIVATLQPLLGSFLAVGSGRGRLRLGLDQVTGTLLVLGRCFVAAIIGIIAVRGMKPFFKSITCQIG
jgi:hypothetical protein